MFILVSIITLITAAIAAATPTSTHSPFLLPVPSGPYNVRQEIQELTDSSRRDYNSTGPRRLIISRFDPIPKHHCIKTEDVPTFPPASAKIEDDVLQRDYKFGDLWIRGLFAASRLKVCSKVRSAYASNLEEQKSNHGFPLLLFSPGFYTTRLLYSSMAQNIASMGYTVITMDHPHDTDVVEFLNGDIILGESTFPDPLPLWQDFRVKDTIFVLDEAMKRSPNARVGMLGHSFGGSTLLSAMVKDGRIGTGVNFDGTLFGSALDIGLGGKNRHFLQFGARAHNRLDNEPSWKKLWETMDRLHPDVWKKEINLWEGRHNSFTDFSVMIDAAGVRDDLDFGVSYNLTGNIKSSRVSGLVTAYVHDFFQFALSSSKDEGLLRGQNPRIPEIGFITGENEM
ncbi:lipase [Arthroderma uncinatum]|uniref:lipase n=1 Tax=Arthroderma uncinatum TaxID=74035 RepID=UPI00144A9060|nr:lipase [Arthroderma uncinatum]KAF3479417.1 lipase [Arthroderma uncinatum]